MRSTLIAALATGSLTLSVIAAPVHADDAGAFIGGVFAAKVMDNMQRRTRAEEARAYQSRQPAPTYRNPSPPNNIPSSRSAESRLRELDKLAAGGYITPEEYKAKKQRIIDSM